MIVAPSPWMPSGGVAGAPLSACHNWTALAPRRAVATSAPPTAIALSAPPTRTDRRLRPLSVTLRTFAVRSPRASARRGARTTEPCRRESTRCSEPDIAARRLRARSCIPDRELSAVAVPPLLAARTSVRSASPHGRAPTRLPARVHARLPAQRATVWSAPPPSAKPGRQ